MSSQPQVIPLQIPMSKLLEEIGRLTVQLRISEENAAQLVRNSEALSKRLQETLKENAELKAQIDNLTALTPVGEPMELPPNTPEETVSKSNYAA